MIKYNICEKTSMFARLDTRVRRSRLGHWKLLVSNNFRWFVTDEGTNSAILCWTWLTRLSFELTASASSERYAPRNQERMLINMHSCSGNLSRCWCKFVEELLNFFFRNRDVWKQLFVCVEAAVSLHRL